MATKEEVADYINDNYESAWTDAEEAKITKQKLQYFIINDDKDLKV